MTTGPPRPSSDEPPADLGVSVTGDPDTAVLEVSVHGRWSRRMCLATHLAMRNCLAAHPTAVIVDLNGLSDLDAASTATWLAASRAATLLRPPARLVLSLPPTRRLASQLRRLGAVRVLSIHATMAHARAAVAGRMPPDRLQLGRLAPEPASAEVAADAVTVACTAWGLPDLTRPSRQVTRELVANAITQAGTDMTLTVSLRGSGLHLAVHDRDQRLPCLVDPAAPDPGAVLTSHGWRLGQVTEKAGAWGAVRTGDGKTVWAIVRPRRPAPASEGRGLRTPDPGGGAGTPSELPTPGTTA